MNHNARIVFQIPYMKKTMASYPIPDARPELLRLRTAKITPATAQNTMNLASLYFFHAPQVGDSVSIILCFQLMNLVAVLALLGSVWNTIPFRNFDVSLNS